VKAAWSFLTCVFFGSALLAQARPEPSHSAIMEAAGHVSYRISNIPVSYEWKRS